MMATPPDAQAPAHPALGRKIGIFRRIAVERYMRPLEDDAPETLARARPGLALAGIALTLLAAWILFQ